jgi:hypothetical protein
MRNSNRFMLEIRQDRGGRTGSLRFNYPSHIPMTFGTFADQ